MIIFGRFTAPPALRHAQDKLPAGDPGPGRDGLVTRTVTPSIPPRVDYELTQLGQSLRGAACALVGWANASIGDIHVAQARYDAAHDERDAA